nr:hypothetical protein [Streptomyces canus]
MECCGTPFSVGARRDP